MKGYITRGKRFARLADVEAYLRKVCASFGPLTDEQWQHLARHGARRGEDGELILKYDPKIGEGAASTCGTCGASSSARRWCCAERNPKAMRPR